MGCSVGKKKLFLNKSHQVTIYEAQGRERRGRNTGIFLSL